MPTLSPPSSLHVKKARVKERKPLVECVPTCLLTLILNVQNVADKCRYVTVQRGYSWVVQVMVYLQKNAASRQLI